MTIIIGWLMSPPIQFGVIFLLILWYLSRKRKKQWIKNIGMSLVAAFGVTLLIQTIVFGVFVYMERGIPLPVDF